MKRNGYEMKCVDYEMHVKWNGDEMKGSHTKWSDMKLKFIFLVRRCSSGKREWWSKWFVYEIEWRWNEMNMKWNEYALEWNGMNMKLMYHEMELDAEDYESNSKNLNT
jgi:hypothetical protein